MKSTLKYNLNSLYSSYLGYFTICLMIVLIPSASAAEMINPTQTGKFISFNYFLIAIIGFVAFRVAVAQNIFLIINGIDVVLLFLLFYITANRYWIQPMYGFSLKYSELLGLSALYVIFRFLPKKTFIYLLLGVVVAGTIQACHGTLQLYDFLPSHHTTFKMTGSFFNPGPFAGFLAAAFPVALGLYLFRSRFEKLIQTTKCTRVPFTRMTFQPNATNKAIYHLLFDLLPIGGILLTILALGASRSRASWLAIVTSSVLLLEARYKFFNKALTALDKGWKKTAVGAALLIMLGVGGYGFYHFKQGSADGRLLIWKVTSHIIADHSWVGVGYDRFKAYYMDYQANYFDTHSDSDEGWVAGDNNYAFNELLGFLSEEGLVGGILLCALTAICLRSLTKTRLFEIQIIALAGLLSITIFGMFSYPSEILPINICLFIYLALLTSEINPTWRLSFPINLFIKGLMAAVIILFIALDIRAVGKIQKAYQDWQTAFQIYQVGFYEESVKKYDEIYPILKRNGEYLTNYGKALSMAGKDTNAIAILDNAREYHKSTITETTIGNSYKALQQYKKAENAYKDTDRMIPTRLYPKYLLAMLYHEIGDKDRALREAKKLLKKEVKIRSTATDEIRSEMLNLVKVYQSKNSSYN